MRGLSHAASDYASLMITAYDHYVNIPMATRVGAFRKPEKQPGHGRLALDPHAERAN